MSQSPRGQATLLASQFMRLSVDYADYYGRLVAEASLLPLMICDREMVDSDTSLILCR